MKLANVVAVAFVSSVLVSLVACSGASDDADHGSAPLVPGVALCEHPSLGCDPAPSGDDAADAASGESDEAHTEETSPPPDAGGGTASDAGTVGKKDGGADAGAKLHCGLSATTGDGCPSGEKCCANPNPGKAPLCVAGKVCPQ